MSSLPPALDFAKAEEAICDKWAEEGTFKTQDKLGKERGDEVCVLSFSYQLSSSLQGAMRNNPNNAHMSVLRLFCMGTACACTIVRVTDSTAHMQLEHCPLDMMRDAYVYYDSNMI